MVSGGSADSITFPLSMVITDFVLRPKDASISSPLSRTSCIILLIGADSGLTTDMIRSAEMRFPNPILINFISLYILDLFPDLLDF